MNISEITVQLKCNRKKYRWNDRMYIKYFVKFKGDANVKYFLSSLLCYGLAKQEYKIRSHFLSPLLLLGLLLLCLTCLFPWVYYFGTERRHFGSSKSGFFSCVRKMEPSNIFCSGHTNPDMLICLHSLIFIGTRITMDRNLTVSTAVIQTNEDMSDGLRVRMCDWH